MCNLSWTPHSSLEKDNSLKTTPVLARRWAVWSILTKNLSCVIIPPKDTQHVDVIIILKSVWWPLTPSPLAYSVYSFENDDNSGRPLTRTELVTAIPVIS